MHVDKTGRGFKLHDSPYAQRLSLLPPTATFDLLRGRRHELVWLTHPRPDLLAPVAILTQGTSSTHTTDHTKLLNKIIRAAQSNPNRGLTQHPLDKNTLRLVVYSDSSFANLIDQGTQLGYFILLTHDSWKVNWLHYASYKFRRVVMSVLAG